MFFVIRWFFMALGFISFLLLSTGLYLWVSDWNQLRTTVNTWRATGSSLSAAPTTDDVSASDGNAATLPITSSFLPTLPTREEATETIMNLSPIEQECLVKALGQARVDEIVAGTMPSATEIAKGMRCL